jgi:hypothetical protein
MRLSDLRCAGCGSDQVMSVDPGHLPVYEHPRDMFGLPDLRQKPVVTDPGRPVVGLCIDCLSSRYPALNNAGGACVSR